MSDESEVKPEIIQQDELSADLSAAWDESIEESEESQTAQEIDDGDSGDGIETTAEDTSADNTADAEAEDSGEPTQETEGEPTARVEEPDSDIPPDSLPPAAREAWKDTPQVMRESIAKREKEFAAGIMKYAQGAKQAAQMNKMIEPYGQYIQMNGGPGQAINGLLQTGSMLQMGSPQQKAQIVSQLINQFGVDIATLDNMLVGQAPPEGTQQDTSIQQAVQQAVAPYQQEMQHLQQQRQYAENQQRQQVATEVDGFGANHEFYNDVRGTMANMLDAAAQGGRKMDMEEAYKLSVAMHPEIAPIIAARTNTASLAEKRKAAVSITGNQGGAADKTIPDDLTSQLNAAWDAVGRR